MSKVKIFLAVIVAITLGFVLAGNFGLLDKSSDKEKNLLVSVTLLDESQPEDGRFKNVFNQERTFIYDEKLNQYRLCVGETSPMTQSSSCHITNNVVEVLHQINKDAQTKPFYLCLYLNRQTTECKIGDQNSEFYDQADVIGK